MANDSLFIINAIEALKLVSNAVRRGQIYGPVVEALNFNLINIGAGFVRPLSLHRRPVRFAVPTNFNLRTGERVMAVQGIRGDMGTKCPVEFDNIAGSEVPEPTGTPVITVSGSVATVALDSDGSSVDIYPIQPPVTNTPFTVTYTLGSIVFTQDFEVTPDLVATQGHFKTTEDSNIPLPSSDPAPAPAGP